MSSARAAASRSGATASRPSRPRSTPPSTPVRGSAGPVLGAGAQAGRAGLPRHRRPVRRARRRRRSRCSCRGAFDHLLGYLGTWSPRKRFLAERGKDALEIALPAPARRLGRRRRAPRQLAAVRARVQGLTDRADIDSVIDNDPRTRGAGTPMTQAALRPLFLALFAVGACAHAPISGVTDEAGSRVEVGKGDPAPGHDRAGRLRSRRSAGLRHRRQGGDRGGRDGRPEKPGRPAARGLHPDLPDRHGFLQPRRHPRDGVQARRAD